MQLHSAPLRLPMYAIMLRFEVGQQIPGIEVPQVMDRQVV
jgi:hypothetical protein